MILLSMYKKILVSVLLFAVVLVNLALPSLVSAQTWWAPTLEDFNNKVNDPAVPANEIFGERYTHAQVWWIVYSMILLVFGTDSVGCAAQADGSQVAFATCLVGLLSSGGDIGVFALASMTDGLMISRPVSGINYLSSVANKLGFPEAQAQQGGFGFTTALQPVLGVWAASRNAAYALMTFAVIILAFMIMFRTRISPQASVSVQVAIPRIIIGLLLITFSYAIAGFVVDLSYVAQGIIAAILHPSELIVTDGWSVVDVFNQMNDVGAGIVAYGLIILAYALVGGFAGSILTGGALILVSIIIILLLLLLFLVALVRIFWLLLRTYVIVLFHVITLPFAALGYVAMPSTNTFVQLLRSLVAHVSVFVTVTLATMFAHLMFWNMSGNTYQELQGFAIFNPYRASIENFPAATVGFPGFGATDVTGLSIFIGLIILLTTPGIANGVRAWIASGRYQAGAGAGPTFAPLILGGQVFGQDYVTKSSASIQQAIAAGNVTPQVRLRQALNTLIRGASGGKIK